MFQYLTSQKGFTGLGKGIRAKSFEVMLRAKYKGGYSDDQVKSNFTKFLVDRDGNVVGRYEPTLEPKSMTQAIEELLAR